MRAVLSRRALMNWRGTPYGKGAASKTPENMNELNYMTGVGWAREDKDFKIDSQTYVENFWRMTKSGRIGFLPGDALPAGAHKLDGWHHVVGYGVGQSKSRIPETVDPVNWRPTARDETELFHKRREHHVKNRRKFWVMRYNPQTETYFKEEWSDRNVTQYDWSNSGWFRITANHELTSNFWLPRVILKFVCCIFGIYEYMRWHEHNATAGRIWAPATDMVNWEIEVVDMTKNLYNTLGKYENGEFKPYNKE